MNRLAIALPVCLTACASTSPAPPASRPAPPLQARMEADPTWRPGDADPTAAKLAMTEPYACPPDADRCAVQLNVEIRNRCGEPVRFMVGPPVDGRAPREDAPINELAPGQAIAAWVPSHYEFYVAGPDGAYSIHAPAWKALVFVGDGACEHIYVDRGGSGQVVSMQR